MLIEKVPSLCTKNLDSPHLPPTTCPQCQHSLCIQPTLLTCTACGLCLLRQLRNIHSVYTTHLTQCSSEPRVKWGYLSEWIQVMSCDDCCFYAIVDQLFTVVLCIIDAFLVLMLLFFPRSYFLSFFPRKNGKTKYKVFFVGRKRIML